MDSRLGLPVGTVLADSYRVLRQIGGGGFGITYAAEDIRLGTTVAIKEYYPEAFGDRDSTMTVRPKSERHKSTFDWGKSSFLQEARMLARFQHPSIVRVSRVFEAHSTAYMVMDFERGENFDTWLNRLGRAPTQDELDRIAAPLLGALEMMHDEKFLHRDIAPDNIIVRADGTPVLLDFGAARRAIAERSHALTGIVKAGYSPNEQYSSDSRLQGPWSDLYALGGTLYRAVVGVAPEEATLRVADDRMRPTTEAARGDYRRGFLSAIDACLRVRYSERPQSVAELRSMLFETPNSTLRFAATRRFSSGALPVQTWGGLAAGAVILVAGAYGAMQFIPRSTDQDAKARNDASIAKAKADYELRAKEEAEALRRARQAAIEQPAEREGSLRAPDAPFAEYFKDLRKPSAQSGPSALPAVGKTAPRLSGRGWIGVKMASVTDAWADSVGAKQGEGAIVAAVTPDSPALRAGLQEGDIIVRFDGKAVSGIHELPQLIRGTKVGKTVAIEVWRDNRLVTLQAKVGQTEDDTQQTRSRRHRN